MSRGDKVHSVTDSIASAEEYARRKRHGQQVLDLNDFTEADIEALERSFPQSESAAFDFEALR
ncbi:hypothetical protein AZA_88529 [Nitrospirillum viridazoti Y2]|uniref:hypothetical protein n=1 Tax=Nitrospirillum viridazoti TaxID=3144925 RepID=UPI00022659C1|nr:hypothetical protein [Nitrospirillum amazonense]EGY01615.1 hypothetical protein AZA_88529 [Nitrospirillum amazonense Y2]